MNLRKFGHGGGALESGIDLSYLIGWLEGLAGDEEENLGAQKGAKTKRHQKVTDAIALLYEAAAFSESDQS